MITGMALSGLAVVPAAAESAEPPVAANAWYWEDKQSEEFTTPNGEKVVVETPNPFCPGPGSALGEPSQTCAEARLPVEIQGGDYETPNKLSAVQFDLFTIPVGSTVSEFTVSFLEAKAGCYDTGNPPPSNIQCEETDPINIDGKKLQACLVTEIFGDGDARQYKEMPKFKCSTTDPVATRKEVKPKGDPEAEPDHVWKFDLTPFAQQWVDKFTVVTSILITAAPPKEETGGTDNWRVVLAGPKFKNGITSRLVYEPPTETEEGGTDTDTTTTTTTTGSGTTGFGTSGTDFGSSDFGDGGGFGGGGGSAPPVDAGGDEEAAGAVDEIDDAVTLPWYVVAASVAGLIAFSLVRSAVVEAATGIRPDGVLAQIRRINAERKGVSVASPGESTGALAGISEALASFSAKVSGVTGKLFRKEQG